MISRYTKKAILASKIFQSFSTLQIWWTPKISFKCWPLISFFKYCYLLHEHEKHIKTGIKFILCMSYISCHCHLMIYNNLTGFDTFLWNDTCVFFKMHEQFTVITQCKQIVKYTLVENTLNQSGILGFKSCFGKNVKLLPPMSAVNNIIKGYYNYY